MSDINIAKANIETAGFLDIDVDVNLDLFAEINRLKKEKMRSCLRIITRSRIYRI